jgi:hypothetical protein
MTRLHIIAVTLGGLALAGCGSTAGNLGLGAAGGAAAGAGGYEYHLKQQRDLVEDAYRDQRISREEYQIRMDQIDRDSALGL